MDFLAYFFVAIIGLVVGSFLNVLVLRLNTGRPIISGRSECLSCRSKLSWYELLPVVSFIAQGGRCHHCHSHISWQYLIVEVITASVFALLAVKYGISLPLIWYAVIFSILIAISVYDLRHKIIPDALVYTFIVLAFLTMCANYGWSLENVEVSYDLLAGPILFSFFALLWLVSLGKWMGFGDAKLALGAGLMLAWGMGLAAMAIGFWLGAIVGIVLLFVERQYLTMKHEIPLAPFLVVGIFLAFILNINVFDWIY